MKEITLVINSTNGLHARPATELVNKANIFKSDITITKNGNQGNAKSIISVMTLAIGPGEVFQIKAEGPDENEAIEDLEDLLVKLED